jgi:hypothetical protein
MIIIFLFNVELTQIRKRGKATKGGGTGLRAGQGRWCHSINGGGVEACGRRKGVQEQSDS